MLRRAYEHEDIALAAKIGVWASLADEEIVAAGLPPRPTGFDLAEGASIFQGLEEASTPQDKLLVVKRATWAIQGAQALPADDLLPLFVELLAQVGSALALSSGLGLGLASEASVTDFVVDLLSHDSTAVLADLGCGWFRRALRTCSARSATSTSSTAHSRAPTSSATTPQTSALPPPSSD